MTDPILEVINDPLKRESLSRRMSEKVLRGHPNECWPWIARASCSGGYGAINAGRGPKLRAHRVAWVLAGGDLENSKVLRHKCDNPKCCNPTHLVLGTQIENIADMRARKRAVNPPIHRGEKHHRASIPDADISMIRSDKRSTAELARIYSVSWNTIYRIRKGISR